VRSKALIHLAYGSTPGPIMASCTRLDHLFARCYGVGAASDAAWCCSTVSHWVGCRGGGGMGRGTVGLANRSAQLSAIWQQEGQSLQADVAVQMQRLTLDIVGMVAFSHNFGQVDAMQKLGATAGENEIPTDRILHDINVAQVRALVRSRPLPTSSSMAAPWSCIIKGYGLSSRALTVLSL
jgi:hypothetical protein